MQQENQRIPPESILFATEMEGFSPGSKWLYDAVRSGFYLFTVYNHNHFLTQFVQLAKDF